MPWILLTLLVLAVVFGPMVWAKAVLAWHGDDRPDYPGTGGELARQGGKARRIRLDRLVSDLETALCGEKGVDPGRKRMRDRLSENRQQDHWWSIIHCAACTA